LTWLIGVLERLLPWKCQAEQIATAVHV
jgi:hypothetical protein